MAQNTDSNSQTPPVVISTSGTGDPNPPSSQPPIQNLSQPQDPTPPPATRAFSEAEVAEMVSKARADEKNKVFSKLDALKGEKSKSDQRIAELENSLKDTQSNLDDVRQGKASEMESITKELGTLRETNTKLESAIQAVADNAAEKIRFSELKAFKAEKIRDSGIKLVEMVSGDTEEEIDASIKKVIEKENSLREELREDVRKELAADLPSPISADGQLGRGPSPNVTPGNREAIARLKGDEYQKRRQQLLEEAKQKVGLS